MDFSFLLEGKVVSLYECSKRSNIPYSTLSDILKGRTPIEKVRTEYLHALAKTLDMSMDDLYSSMHVPERSSFETYKSQVRHEVKRIGDVAFINETLNADMINRYWRWEWYHESFYLLAMLDYLCRLNGIEISSRYDSIREYRLPETVFPLDVSVAAKISNNLDIRDKAIEESIPEFMKYNIVEKDIRDVY